MSESSVIFLHEQTLRVASLGQDLAIRINDSSLLPHTIEKKTVTSRCDYNHSMKRNNTISTHCPFRKKKTIRKSRLEWVKFFKIFETLSPPHRPPGRWAKCPRRAPQNAAEFLIFPGPTARISCFPLIFPFCAFLNFVLIRDVQSPTWTMGHFCIVRNSEGTRF